MHRRQTTDNISTVYLDKEDLEALRDIGLSDRDISRLCPSLLPEDLGPEKYAAFLKRLQYTRNCCQPRRFSKRRNIEEFGQQHDVIMVVETDEAVAGLLVSHGGVVLPKEFIPQVIREPVIISKEADRFMRVACRLPDLSCWRYLVCLSTFDIIEAAENDAYMPDFRKYPVSYLMWFLTNITQKKMYTALPVWRHNALRAVVMLSEKPAASKLCAKCLEVISDAPEMEIRPWAFHGSNVKIRRGLILSENGKVLLGTTDDFYQYSIKVPEGVEVIADKVFNCNSSLRKITLPSTLRVICEDSIMACRSLGRMVVPESVRHIGTGFLSLCDELRHVDFRNPMDQLSPGTCAHCKNLASVVLPKDIVAMQDCFTDCDNISNLQHMPQKYIAGGRVVDLDSPEDTYEEHDTGTIYDKMAEIVLRSMEAADPDCDIDLPVQKHETFTIMGKEETVEMEAGFDDELTDFNITFLPDLSVSTNFFFGTRSDLMKNVAHLFVSRQYVLDNADRFMHLHEEAVARHAIATVDKRNWSVTYPDGIKEIWSVDTNAFGHVPFIPDDCVNSFVCAVLGLEAPTPLCPMTISVTW